ncbi:LOW QUALITY PROTEIN: hypothetical protein V1477_017443 [Vespula maculifrons]|uniref:Uncharacterized protein n=1 Tax=Vespula maculifrons TaxID=7453 RepID=A0ABD2B608_VESMC
MFFKNVNTKINCEVVIFGFARRQQNRTDNDNHWFSSTLNFDEYTSQFPQHSFSANSNEETTRRSTLLSTPVTTTNYWFSSTLNFDIDASQSRSTRFPQVVTKRSCKYITNSFDILYDLFRFKTKWRSGDAFPTSEDCKTASPWVKSTFNFDMHAFSASSNEEVIPPALGSNLLSISTCTRFPQVVTKRSCKYITNSFDILYDLFRFKTKWRSGDAFPTSEDCKALGSNLLTISTCTRFPQVVTKRSCKYITNSFDILYDLFRFKTKWRSGDAFPTSEDCKGIYLPDRQPLGQIYLQFRHARVFRKGHVNTSLILSIFYTIYFVLKQNGEVGMPSPPVRTAKVYICQTANPWVKSTYNFDDDASQPRSTRFPQPVGPQMQQPPRGRTWVGSTCNISKSMSKLYLLVQLCFGLRRGNLEILAEAIRVNINEQTEMQSGDTIPPEPTTKSLLVQLSFGVRRGDLEIFAEAIRANINEQLLVQLCFGLRRGNLEIFAEAIRVNINEQTEMQSGDTIPPETTTKSLLVQLSFGVRRGDLEIFAEAIRANINEQVIQIYNILFNTELQSGDTIPPETTTKSTEMQSGDTIPPETTTKSLLVQLSFGVRRGDLEIFAEAIRANINEQVIQIYLYLNCEVGILSFEGRQQSQLLVQLCIGLRRGNLEILAEAIRVNINEQTEMQSGDTIPPETTTKSLLVQLSFGVRRGDLEIFAEAIRANINEQVIQIYNILFDTEMQSGDTIPPETTTKSLLVQLCIGLRRGNLEILVEAIRVNINEQTEMQSGDTIPVGTTTKSDAIQGVLTKNFRKYNTLFIFSKFCTISFVSAFDFRLSRDFDNLSLRVDLEIFPLSGDLKSISTKIFTFSRDFNNLSPRVDLEIFPLSGDLKSISTSGLRNFSTFRRLKIYLHERQNLSPRVDLEIFPLSGDLKSISTSGLRNFSTFRRLKIYLHEWT